MTREDVKEALKLFKLDSKSSKPPIVLETTADTSRSSGGAGVVKAVLQLRKHENGQEFWTVKFRSKKNCHFDLGTTYIIIQKIHQTDDMHCTQKTRTRPSSVASDF